MDLIADYAFPLPTIVIAELLGIPPQDRYRFRNWSSALVTPSGRSSRNAKKLAKSGQLMDDFIAYLSKVVTQRRGNPESDLITSLIQAEEHGDVLSEEELYSMILLLIVVGHETTVNLIGNGMLCLFRHPNQYAQLLQQRELLPGAIEEMIRYDCPVERAPMRFATEDWAIHGQQIRRGDAISLVLGSANRDPAHFDDPDTFDIRRKDNKHLGFGLGIHYCLGAPLARLEGRIGIGALLERLPGLHLAIDSAELRWRTNPIMRGVQRMPVRWNAPA
jgi:cytochrome P450